jgi:predicted nucleic acid-binding Zn finger protein
MNTAIEEVLQKLRKQRTLTGAILQQLHNHCGSRFWKALQAVANNLVKKYFFEPSGREAWIVVGKNRDYRILSEIYCDCDDFYINVIVKRRAETCYHILAKILAESISIFQELRVDDMNYEALRQEWDEIASPRTKNQEVLHKDD